MTTKANQLDPALARCLPNQEYATLIKKAAYKHFNPFSLGDLSELVHKQDCNIETAEDAHKAAQGELSRLLGDSYTNVEDRKPPEELETPLENNMPGRGRRPRPKPQDNKPPNDGKPPQDVKPPIDKTQPDKSVVEEKVRVDVEERDLGNGISYIRLVDFKDEGDAQKMKEALERQKDAKALVIDLRGNPGGRVDEALDIASMLISSGNLVRTLHRESSDPANPEYVSKDISLSDDHLVTRTTSLDGHTRVKREDRAEYIINGKPVVVLVDGSSASASELLTGALKYNHSATIVGKPTFGKGMGQETIEINDQHSLKATTFRFASPDGVWPGDAHNKRYGIKPDIDVARGYNVKIGSDQDQQLKTALSVLNRKLGRT